MNRREFLLAGGAAAVCYAGAARAAADVAAAPEGLALRFLGTGAADWAGRDDRGELRRFSSVLLEKRLLIDFTAHAAELLPDGCRPEAIFYTHSHGDHYNPVAACRLGVRRVFVQAGWAERARTDFAKAASAAGCPAPEVVPLEIGTPVECGGLRLTPLPANHATGDIHERTLIYLVEKGPVRLLYATDTAGITSVAHLFFCRRPLTGIIMEATVGLGHVDDWRIFDHSDVPMVGRTVRVLVRDGAYKPPIGQPVYLTHLARTLHGTQRELDATLPPSLRAASDGLDVVFG